MRLLEILTKEFINIVEYLTEIKPVESNRIIIEREEFKELLEKYHYMKFKDKTKIYKQLHFIIHDKNNYTMPCKNSETKKTERKVIINYDTYLTMKQLYNTVID